MDEFFMLSCGRNRHEYSIALIGSGLFRYSRNPEVPDETN